MNEFFEEKILFIYDLNLTEGAKEALSIHTGLFLAEEAADAVRKGFFRDTMVPGFGKTSMEHLCNDLVNNELLTKKEAEKGIATFGCGLGMDGEPLFNRKNFVLDTNILLHNPNALTCFAENNVFIPHMVIEELDGLKSAPGETGYCAREVTRKLMEMRENGNLFDGIENEEGGMIYEYYAKNLEIISLPAGWKFDKPDNIILMTTMEIDRVFGGAILVSNDSNMHLKADVLGVKIEQLKNDRLTDGKDLYSGRTQRHCSQRALNWFYDKETRAIPLEELEDDNMPAPIENEFVIVKDWANASAIGKVVDNKIVPLEHVYEHPCDLKARNVGQTFLKEALLTDASECPLTICVGPAGTGKTLFALGCGLHQVMEIKKYKRVLLCRANVLMDEEIGFLPGSEQDKIEPLMRGAFDNLGKLLGSQFDSKEMEKDKIDELLDRGYLEMQSVGYLRGRSIDDTYIIIDEAQNCTPNQILSIITRAGRNSKFVLLGDPNQIDHPRLDKRNCGITFAIERMKGSSLTQITSFTEDECERSPLAKEASDRLKR